jgi:AraC-like DNA-binding protein
MLILDKYDDNQFSAHPNIVKLIVSALISMGENPEAVLRQAGIEQHVLDTHQRIPSKDMTILWQLCCSRCLYGEFSIHLSKVLLPQHLHRLGDMLVTSENMLDILQQVVKYSTLLTTALYAQLIVGKKSTQLIFKLALPNFNIHTAAFESGMVILITLLKKLVPQDAIGLKQVHMMRSPPSSNCYQDFFQADVEFLAKHHSLVFCNSHLHQPLPLFDNDIRTHQEQLMLQDLQEIYHPTFIYQVTNLIELNLSSSTNIETCVADELSLSVRTLQRRLSKHQTSFSALLKEVRFAKAKQELMSENCPIKRLAFLLGFNSATSFSRAFKQWSGMSPKTYRGRNN